MDPNNPPSAPHAGWNPDKKSDMENQPPPYQQYGTDCPALQGGYSGQPGYPPGQPYGTPYSQPYQDAYAGQPTVVAQPTVYVTSGPLPQPLPDYLGYSIFTLMCCCLPLGIVALVYSINTREANITGNRLQAERNSRLARILNHTALGIGIMAFVLSIVFVLVTVLSVH